jgi:adenylate cyclase
MPVERSVAVMDPAVNEVSRIMWLCGSLQRKKPMSASFAAIVPQAQLDNLLSIGEHALLEVNRAQERFALIPGL